MFSLVQWLRRSGTLAAHRRLSVFDRVRLVNSALHDACEVAVVGAGPYGLSLGAHLNSAGIETRVFGRPMSFWREHMPKGMKLRSPWAATHIVDPDDLLTLDAYAAVTSLGRPDPLPLADFVRYGEWFQKTALPRPPPPPGHEDRGRGPRLRARPGGRHHRARPPRRRRDGPRQPGILPGRVRRPADRCREPHRRPRRPRHLSRP